MASQVQPQVRTHPLADSPPLTPDDILDMVGEIVQAAHALTTFLNARFASIEPSGLAPFALRAIHLAGRRGLSQIDLARTLKRSAPSATRLVDHLEREGMVFRSAHPSDRRINMIHLSEKGESALTDVLAKSLSIGRQVFDMESVSTINRYRSKLSRLVHISEII